MPQRYGLPLSKKQRKLFEVWSKSDPIDDWEREKNKRVNLIQGNTNPFIDHSPY